MVKAGKEGSYYNLIYYVVGWKSVNCIFYIFFLGKTCIKLKKIILLCRFFDIILYYILKTPIPFLKPESQVRVA